MLSEKKKSVVVVVRVGASPKKNTGMGGKRHGWSNEMLETWLS
jgi:hypothetical protein